MQEGQEIRFEFSLENWSLWYFLVLEGWICWHDDINPRIPFYPETVSNYRERSIKVMTCFMHCVFMYGKNWFVRVMFRQRYRYIHIYRERYWVIAIE